MLLSFVSTTFEALGFLKLGQKYKNSFPGFLVKIKNLNNEIIIQDMHYSDTGLQIKSELNNRFKS